MPRVEVPKTLRIEMLKASRRSPGRGGECERMFPPQPTRNMGKLSQWARVRARSQKYLGE